MKFVYKRATRKLKNIKFYCKRCGCKFMANLYPDCTAEYDEFTKREGERTTFIQGFTNIRCVCPDCGEIAEYDKIIPLIKDDIRC